MSKVFIVAGHRFRQEVFKRGFLIALLSMPAFVALSVGMGVLASRLEEKRYTVGYVDQAGLLAVRPADSDRVALVDYGAQEAGEEALRSGDIDALYLLQADASAGAEATLLYLEQPASVVQRHMADAVRLNLLAGRPAATVERILKGPEVTVRAIESDRVFPAGGPTVRDFAPMIAAVLYAFLVLITSSTLMLAVVEEKENRTMEVVVTSVSTGQMMTGKVIGVVAMAAVLLAAWIAVFVLAAWLGGSVLNVEWLQDLDLRWRDLAMLAVAAVPSFAFLAAFMTLLGSTLVENQEAQQIGPFMFLALMVPLYAIVPIAEAPDGAVAMLLTLFPLTSVMTIGIRSMFGVVPTWHVLLAAGIALACAVVMIWLAGKALRISMLRYGQRLDLRTLFAR